MTWFESLVGFPETSPAQVRANLTVDGSVMTSQVNGRVLVCGDLETPSLAGLRQRVRSSGRKTGKLSLREVVADVQRLHADEANAGALFQVASQFNLLEMTSPSVTPEHGVGIYEYDRTQGPACAIAAGAGTIYRNYFAVVDGQVGQSERRQIDCLADLGAALGNTGGRLWEMRNGYALASKPGLAEISQRRRLWQRNHLDHRCHPAGAQAQRRRRPRYSLRQLRRIQTLRATTHPPVQPVTMPTLPRNTLFYGDNLPILREWIDTESVDLVYLGLHPLKSDASSSSRSIPKCSATSLRMAFSVPARRGRCLGMVM